MKPFPLTVSSPEGNLFLGECVKLDVRGVEGSLAIMAGHIPFVTALVSGPCTIYLEDGTKKEADLEGGVLSVDTDGAILLSGSFRFCKEN